MKKIVDIINEEIEALKEEENTSNVTFEEIKAGEGDWQINFKIITDGGMRMYIVTPYYMSIRPYRKDFPEGRFYSYGRERRFGVTKGTTVERTDEEGFYKAVNTLLKRQNKSI